MFITQKYLENRRAEAIGTINSYVPGHGGDVWWVIHDDGTTAAYCVTEMREDNVIN